MTNALHAPEQPSHVYGTIINIATGDSEQYNVYSGQMAAVLDMTYFMEVLLLSLCLFSILCH